MDEAAHGLIRIALAPVRSEPNVRAELISQEPLGAAVTVLEREGEWVEVRGEDGYAGWMSDGALRFCDADLARAWWDELGGRPALSLDATILDDAGSPLVRLPWGARVAVDGETIVLPDGRRGRAGEGRLIAWTSVADLFPGSGPAVVDTAFSWIGVPYLWGGRTRWGADCSGFVQAVYRLHGFQLPRDSHQQAEYGEPVDHDGGLNELQPGDLVFFHATDSNRIVHVGFSLGGPAILHAAVGNGAVQTDRLGETELGSRLVRRLSGVRRFFWS
ncbi:MAG: C40 family peptidase [Gemmatimonadetes bacterium]|uniref:C40 family peptidase n=1 Tax=Candidatus Kutchimonas denitrificans TaxID=3056748 RepID=A0AAE5CDN2_9BACT|nr:C40 family peptidase [Gemmatimonadota bacterium]NIR76124.1 C40 family peptidase [Candidatus Kutchimonas denitrificans]NIS00503.1 C40 family peptidase [Gemmatimonadota bacterium]NIT66161.1 C40 family peptidase [Gemmatimonadota bacterium]NIU54239.1 SH3 domain-containing protein [Gemmatimonadota bacterium]